MSTKAAPTSPSESIIASAGSARDVTTDTASYSDIVFGLFRLLGYRFCPRIADLTDQRLWRIDPHAHYGPLDPLGLALADYGRVAKTLHLLAVLDPDDDSYRRTVNTQLTVQESRHRLARKLFFGQRGELRQRYREGQEDQLSALGLVLNAVVLWNTRYTDAAVHRLRTQG